MCLFDLLDSLDSTQKSYELNEGKTIDALEVRLKIRRQLKLNWRFAAIFPAPTRATKQGKSSGTGKRSSHSFLKVSPVRTGWNHGQDETFVFPYLDGGPAAGIAAEYRC